MLDCSKIRNLRMMHALSQTELAEKAGLSLTDGKPHRAGRVYASTSSDRPAAGEGAWSRAERLYIDKVEGAR